MPLPPTGPALCHDHLPRPVALRVPLLLPPSLPSCPSLSTSALIPIATLRWLACFTSSPCRTHSAPPRLLSATPCSYLLLTSLGGAHLSYSSLCYLLCRQHLPLLCLPHNSLRATCPFYSPARTCHSTCAFLPAKRMCCSHSAPTRKGSAICNPESTVPSNRVCVRTVTCEHPVTGGCGAAAHAAVAGAALGGPSIPAPRLSLIHI